MRWITGSGSRRISAVTCDPATACRAAICSPTVTDMPGMVRLGRPPRSAGSSEAACVRKWIAERGLVIQWRTLSVTGRIACCPTSGSRMIPEKKPEAARLGLPGRTQIVGRRRPMPRTMPRRP